MACNYSINKKLNTIWERVKNQYLRMYDRDGYRNKKQLKLKHGFDRNGRLQINTKIKHGSK